MKCIKKIFSIMMVSAMAVSMFSGAAVAEEAGDAVVYSETDMAEDGLILAEPDKDPADGQADGTEDAAQQDEAEAAGAAESTGALEDPVSEDAGDEPAEQEDAGYGQDQAVPDSAEDADDGDTGEDAGTSDDTADTETAAAWEATLPVLSGVWSDDVAAIAKSQLGYAESTRNFRIDENGEKKGYTRYGAWYGDPYGDWCAMFASFCLHYAGVPESMFPEDENCESWINALSSMGLYKDASYGPETGDLVFFDRTGAGASDHVGIVVSVSDGTVTTVEGNSGDAVKSRTYSMSDPDIMGYGVLPEQYPEDEADGEDPEYAYFFDGGDFTAEVTFSEDPGFEDGTELAVYEYDDGGEYYLGCIEKAADMYGAGAFGTARLFSVSFTCGDEEVRPQSGAEAAFTFMGSDNGEYTVTCFGEEGAETAESATENVDGSDVVTFEPASFSGILFTTESEAETLATDTVDDILDKDESLTQGGATDSYYKDGHYYHIDIRVDSDFDYIYHNGIFTIVTDTDLIVAKSWQGGIPSGVTSVTFNVCRDNSDGTYTPLYYDEDGFITTEPTHTETGSGPNSRTTEVDNTPVTVTVTQSGGWTGSIELEAGNYVLLEQSIDGYDSSVTYVTVDTSTGEQLTGSSYTNSGHIEVSGVNWVVYEMNDNGNADYHYYDDGAFSGFIYGYLDGDYYSDPSDSQSQTTGDWEFFLDDGNSHGGRGLKFLTDESTIWVNIDYAVYYIDEDGNETSQTFTGKTFEFTPEMWEADNFCSEKDNTNTMRGIDLLIEGQYLMEAVTTRESASEIQASVTNVNEEDDTTYLQGVKIWLDEDGNGELGHDNASEIALRVKRKTDADDGYTYLTEGTDYVVAWNGSTYYVWGHTVPRAARTKACRCMTAWEMNMNT